jgi:hypothetical protein
LPGEPVVANLALAAGPEVTERLNLLFHGQRMGQGISQVNTISLDIVFFMPYTLVL